MSWDHFTDYLDPSHKVITHDLLEELWNATNERAQAVGGEIIPDAPGTIGKVVSCRYKDSNGSMDPDGPKPAPYWLNKRIAPNNYLKGEPEVPLISGTVVPWSTNELFNTSVSQQGYPPTSLGFFTLTAPTIMLLNVWRQMLKNCLLIVKNPSSSSGKSFRTYDTVLYSSVWDEVRDDMIATGFAYGGASSTAFQITGGFTGTNFGCLYSAHSTNIEYEFDIPYNLYLKTKGYSIGKGLGIQGDIPSPVDIFINDSPSGTFTPPIGTEENLFQMKFDSEIVTAVGPDVKVRFQYRAASDPSLADLYRPPTTPGSMSVLHRLLFTRLNMSPAWWIRPNFSQPS